MTEFKDQVKQKCILKNTIRNSI